MKKVRNGLMALGLALTMAIALSACDDGGIDASAYVKGLLDQWYIGQVDEQWMKDVDTTQSDMEEIYLDSVQLEADSFVDYVGIDYPEDVNDRLLDLWKEICAKASYQVGEAGKPDADGTYTVKVAIKPLDIYKLIDESAEEFSTNFNAAFADVDANAMTEEEYDAWYENEYDKAYRDGICDLLESLIPQIGYLADQSIVVQVEDDGDGYGLNGNDNSNLASAIIPPYYE